jgi:hypothetical protein
MLVRGGDIDAQRARAIGQLPELPPRNRAGLCFGIPVDERSSFSLGLRIVCQEGREADRTEPPRIRISRFQSEIQSASGPDTSNCRFSLSVA